MFPWSRSKKNESEPESVDVEENGSLGEEVAYVDAAVDVEEEHDDGIFVTENGRKRRSSVAKAVTYAAMGLAVAGTGFATGYGVNVAVRRSRNSSAAASVVEQLQVETPWPTYAPTAVEESAVTVRPSHSLSAIETYIDASTNLVCVSSSI